MPRSVERQRLRAPGADRQTLIQPPLSTLPALLATNAHRADQYDCDVQGRRLLELAAAARGEVVARARDYTACYRNVGGPVDLARRPILLTGQQPELFHPGVWMKNFVLAALARQHGAVGINLLIDTDTIKDSAIRVPGGSETAPTDQRIPFDRQGAKIPFEERTILDRDLFRGFGDRAIETLRPFVRDPILRQLWPLAIGRSAAGVLLGQCLAQARHQLESRWGLSTWELPQSAVCRLEAFYWFAAHLLAQLPRLWLCYNEAVAEYRRSHRIRSRAHPVPDLREEDGWLEAPFWIWSSHEPRRRALFVKPRGGQLVLSDRHDLEITLSLTPDGDAGRACGELADLTKRAIKLRTRAAITTMFARLFLGDVFLHGIGGAKYDALTDQLIRRFFGFEPPEFMVASATLRLPIARRRVTEDDQRRVHRLLREVKFHPERHVSQADTGRPEDQGEVDRWIEQKRRWIATGRTSENARARHAGITSANAALAMRVADKRRQLLTEQRAIAASLRNETIFSSREYAFCLHSEQSLREMMLELHPANA